MKINNNNLNDVLHVVGVAISNTDYNRDCFSVSEVHLYSIIWKEVSLVLEELFKSGVNFDKFILPILNNYEIELDDEKLENARFVNKSEALPENLCIDVDVPYLEGISNEKDLAFHFRKILKS